MTSAALFKEKFGLEPEASASAPGRVNLLGEHTDYNDGFVLPIAIPQRTHVILARSRDEVCQLFSEQLQRRVSFTMDSEEQPRSFAGYVYGCIRLLMQRKLRVGPVCLLISSTVPIGAGLSSSAALEVAVLRGMRNLFSLPVDDVEIALLAQQAEITYAGVNCGIMDQMASSLADTENMLFLDTRTLERRLVPLPEETELLVLDSGVPRSLADSGYNQRRQECDQAAAQLGVKALRDVSDPAALLQLPPLLQRRARHVVTENARVLEALQARDAAHFGQLMNASHASLKDDYEVSIAALDTLVGLLQQHPAVYGARLTGAGFGGACVAMVKKGSGGVVAGEVLNSYRRAGYEGKELVVSG